VKGVESTDGRPNKLAEEIRDNPSNPTPSHSPPHCYNFSGPGYTSVLLAFLAVLLSSPFSITLLHWILNSKVKTYHYDVITTFTNCFLVLFFNASLLSYFVSLFCLALCRSYNVTCLFAPSLLFFPRHLKHVFSKSHGTFSTDSGPLFDGPLARGRQPSPTTAWAEPRSRRVSVRTMHQVNPVTRTDNRNNTTCKLMHALSSYFIADQIIKSR